MHQSVRVRGSVPPAWRLRARGAFDVTGFSWYLSTFAAGQLHSVVWASLFVVCGALIAMPLRPSLLR